MKNLGLGLSMSVLAFGLGACGEFASSNGGDFGATPGGVKDLTFARSLVEKGQVPPPDALLVEAMFAEHDLPISGAPCAETLCLKGAVGRAPDLAGEPRAWAEIGLSSGIDPDTFERPPMSFVATVDVSGSMGWGGDGEEPGQIARRILDDVAGKLSPQDRFALVTYGSDVDVTLDWVGGDDPAIHSAIADLHETGSTNMEAGLTTAFDLAEAEAKNGRETRVLLFTDEQPNVGATSPSDFESMVGDAAEKKVGLTVFGLGLGLGSELMKSMAHMRGGNAFSLTTREDVDPFIADNWPWLAVPIAYGLKVEAHPTAGLSLVESYGFPSGDGGATPSLELASVFLSKNRGGMLLELGGELNADSGVDLDISFVSRDGQPHTASISPRVGGGALDARGVSMPDLGVARATSLAIFTAAMQDAATRYATDHGAAATELDGALNRLEEDASAAQDGDLATEAAFWPKLATLMHADAPQGSLYGYGAE